VFIQTISFFYLLTVVRDQTVFELVDTWAAAPGGRPLGRTTMLVLTSISANISLSLSYALAVVLLCIQAYLIQHVLRFVFQRPAAIVGAILFLLFPADASKTYLVHAFWTQMSSLLFWSCALLFLRGRVRTAGLLAPLGLLIYETHFLLLFLIPLSGFLVWGRREALASAWRFVLFAVLSTIPVLAYRMTFAAGRLSATSEFSISGLIERATAAARIGFVTSLEAYWIRLETLVQNAMAIDIMIGLIAMGIFAFWLYRSNRHPEPYVSRPSSGSLLALFLIGLLAIFVAYLPYIGDRFPPTH
jgi:hypothetical protein